MKKVEIQFIKSAVKPEQYPLVKNSQGHELPELAVAGRSNVGKSSLINHFFFQKKLAKASSVPGKTQLINFFKINEDYTIADLPGYGFAKVPVAIKRQWGPMIEDYLNQRQNLKLLLFLLDIRRLPSEEDLMFLQWATYHKHQVILVLTKADKLKANEIKSQCQKIYEIIGDVSWPCIFYSIKSGQARKDLQLAINQWLKGEL